MRLWHKDLIPVLPKQQLIAQWRECCLIAHEINDKGTPNHVLVNKVLNYPIEHFYRYGRRIYNEMCRRGYDPNWFRFNKYFRMFLSAEYEQDAIFDTWHNDRYLTQCFYNLQEKYDCGGIPDDEWRKLEDLYYETIPTPNRGT